MNVIEVVQGGVLDRDATDPHRRQLRIRVQAPSAANVDQDALEQRCRFLGRELPGDRPARLASNDAEVGLQTEIVDLHDHPVHLKIELVPATGPAFAGGLD